MELDALDIDVQWNLVQDILQKHVHNLFDEHKTNEARYKRNFRVYREVYPNFVYESLLVTLEDSFLEFDKEQYQTSPSGKTP